MSLAEFFPNVFMENNEIKEIMNHFMSMANSSDEYIRNSSLSILCLLTDTFEKEKELRNGFVLEHKLNSEDMMNELIGMFKSGLRKTSSEDRDNNEKVVMIMMNIIMGT